MTEQSAPSNAADHAFILPNTVRRRVLFDMSERIQTALLLYPLIWLLITQFDHFFWRETGVALLILSALTLLSILRRLLSLRLRQLAEDDLDKAFMWFRLLSCGHVLIWGLATAITLVWLPAKSLSLFMIIAGVALLNGATVSLSLDRTLSIGFTLSGIVPFVATALIVRDKGYIVLSLLCVAFAIYVISAARVVRQDYLDGVQARQTAEDRARQLERLSLTDTLTQIPNRLSFDRQYAMAWADARRQKAPVAVALIDLDHFKHINDQHGHLIGDRCLQEAARGFQAELLRPTDMVARYGGEEFIVLMPDTDLAGGKQVAERIVARLATHALSHTGQSIALTCSIGVASVVPEPSHRPAQLIKLADQALYRAKANGRNRVEVAEALPQSELA